MSITLINIPRFIEQVGRRTVKDKKNTLDRIDCIFIGPGSLAYGFLPANGSPHPEFPIMFCEKSEILTQTHALAEVRVSYIGKLIGSPSGFYASSPIINLTSRIGSISYTTTYSTSSTQLATASYTVRYTAKSVSFKYLTNQSNPAPRFATTATPYLGHTNLLQFQSAPLSYETGTGVLVSGVWSGYLNNTLVWEDDLTDFQISDLDNGWYEVTETYTTQPYINSTVV